MRKIVIVLGIVVVVIVVAAGIFVATFDVNRYRGRIQSELQSRLGRQVTLGDMHLSLFPPSFQVNNLSIADDPRFGNSRPFVQAAQLNVSVKLLPLLHKDVQIDSLKLQHPTVELIKNQQGIWNFASLGKTPQNAPSQQPAPSKQKPAPTAPSQGAPEPESKQAAFSLSELAITDGQVALTDRTSGRPRAVYNHIDATLNDFAPGKPFSIDLAAHLPGAGSEEVRLKGKGGPMADNPAETPFHGTLNLNGVALSGLSAFLNNPGLANTDGALSGETKIDSEAGKLSANGSMEIQKARVKGVDIGYPITAQYDLSDDLNSDLVNIRSATIKLGQTPLSINGTLNMKPTPMQLDVRMKAANVAIAEAAKLASAFGVAFAPDVNVQGEANADIQARGAADKPALSGTLSARNVQATGSNIPKPVQIPAVNFQLTPTDIRSDNFKIISDNTTLNANVAVSQYTSKNPVVAANVQAPNAQLPAILSMARAYGITALDKISGLGTLNMNLKLAGPVQSLGSAQVLRALNGTLNNNYNNVRYNGIDISHQLASIAGFLKPGNPGQTDQGFTNISRLTGVINIVNGVAQTNNLQALLDVGNVGITGTADLVTQALNLRLNAVLSKATSQQVGGTGIGGFMNTALANNQGELVIPVLVTGTFQNPKLAPDLQSVAQMRLKGLLPTSDNPQGAAAGLLGGLLGQKSGNQAQGKQQQNPQDAVQQILGGFLGNKKQQPPPPPKKK